MIALLVTRRRFASLGEVGCGGDNDRFRRADLTRTHLGILKISKPDREVDPLLDEIKIALGHDEVERNLRKLRSERAEPRQQV